MLIAQPQGASTASSMHFNPLLSTYFSRSLTCSNNCRF
jgi:hypothetical protein